MPEGPEVRLTVDFLNKALYNKTITKWNFCGGKYTDVPPEGYKEFDSLLPVKIEEIKCKGKFIYFLVNSKKGKSYIFHSLMLTGSWRHNYDNYCKAFIEIDTGKCIWFRDTRGFGFFSFMNTSEQLTKKLERLGPDIMTREFTIGFFKNLIKKYPKRNICPFLMDQEIISGCGNYLKAEVLYYARISPLRKTSDLKEDEIEMLFEGLIVIPRISYNNKGVTLKDFADEDGNTSLNNDLKIYGNKNARKTKTADGRTTYWDPRHQP